MRRSAATLGLLAAASLINGPASLGAQTDTAHTSAPRTARHHTCFRAQPLAACDAWVPLTVTGAARTTGTSHARFSPSGVTSARERDLREYGALGVGYMVNRDSTHAVGGLFEVGSSESGVRLALKAKRQRWLSKRWAVSESFGVLTAQQMNVATDGTTQAYGFTGDVGIDFLDQIGVVVSGDVARGSGHQSAALHAGVRAGSYTALAAAAATAVVGIAVGSSLGHGGLLSGCCSGLLTQRTR